MLYLVRGLPGSGKSTYAKSLGCLVVEADMLCVRDGRFRYDHGRMAAAHEWCLARAGEAMEMGMDVAVANVFAHAKFIRPYMELAEAKGCPVTIVECKGEYGAEHPVPREVLRTMRKTWEPVPAEWEKEACVVVIGDREAARIGGWTGSATPHEWFAVTGRA